MFWRRELRLSTGMVCYHGTFPPPVFSVQNVTRQRGHAYGSPVSELGQLLPVSASPLLLKFMCAGFTRVTSI